MVHERLQRAARVSVALRCNPADDGSILGASAPISRRFEGRSHGRAGRAACVIAALCLAGCGRLGFDRLSLDDDSAHPRRDAGHSPDGEPDGGASAPDDGGSPSAEAGTAMDASLPMGMDGSVEMDGAVPADAIVDAGVDAALDAAPEEDTGVTVDAGPLCAQQTAASFCALLPSLPEAPVIDGVLECGLTLEPITPKHWTAATPYDPNHSARLAVAWRADGLYVFVDVDDATRLPAISTMDTWCGDSIELYVDDDGAFTAAPAYDDPGTAQLVAVAPEDDTTRVVRGQRFRGGATVAEWTSTTFATYPKPGGYVLEAFIAAIDLDRTDWSLAAGQHVGFDVGINLSVAMDPPVGETADCGRRLGQYFFNITDPDCTDGSCLPWQNVLAQCTPELAQ
jgi:hypothetical protein